MIQKLRKRLEIKLILSFEKELRRRMIEAEEEDMELEKVNRVNTFKGVNHISNININNNTTVN